MLLTLILMQTPLKRCLALLASAFALGAGLDAAEPDAKITYKEIDSGDLQLHVFYPAEGKPDEARPAIVFFFGGGWVNVFGATRITSTFSGGMMLVSSLKTIPKPCEK